MRMIICLLLWTWVTQYSFAQSDSFDSWPYYTSMSGQFKIKVPGQMKEKVDTVQTELGQLVYHTYFYQNDGSDGSDNFVYMVSFVDYPEHSVHSDSTALLQEFFTATMDEAEFSINGELIYRKAIEEDGYPGYLWRINYRENSAMIKTKAFVRERRYYSIQAVTLKELGMNRQIDRFLDSFQLLN